MILLVNILVIASSYFSNGEFSSLEHKYFNPDYSDVFVILNNFEERGPENIITSFRIEHQRKMIHFSGCVINNLNKHNINKSISFLNRLLPNLIDEPPPTFEIYIS